MEKEKKNYKNGSKMGDRKPSRGRKFNNEKRSSSSSSSSTSSFSSEEETDVRDLKPIRGYLVNRRELARQLFKSVKSDKIRMMLPQILKNMNLSDLEEWCSSELCGMSEARITCIINGQPMLDSSDTSETDDSGPSLEIISDTEEWLSDADIPIKEEPSSSGVSKTKRSKGGKSKMNKAHGQKRSDRDKLRAGVKGDNAIVTVESVVKVKKEKEKMNRSDSMNKEGESLLDLLELEMRARAIRALIRKEEDIIPSAASEKRMALTANALRNTLNSAVTASLSTEKSLNGKFNVDGSTENNENNEKPVEKLTCSSKTTEAIEDEDVVFVVAQPTPTTIELLSSESENDNERNENDKQIINKSVDDEIVQTSTKTGNHRPKKDDAMQEITLNCDGAINTATTERIVTIGKSSDGTDSLKIVITKRVSESADSPSPSKSSKTRKSLVEKGDKNCTKIGASDNDTIPDNIVKESATHAGKGLFKKIKRKQHLRTKRKTLEDSSTERDQVREVLENSLPTPLIANADAEFASASVVAAVKLEVVEHEESRSDESSQKIDVKGVNETRRVKQQRPVSLDDDRLDDFEEIINLDDYSDDMDENESIDDNETMTSEVASNNTHSQPTQCERRTPLIINETIIPSSADSSETWASRYYQTDDVQNVIKESKIQSEIRKRLRERQRLSKLNSSPKLNSPGDATILVEKNEDKIEPKLTSGSVQEYLALKNSTSASTVDNADNLDANATENSPDVKTIVTKNSMPSTSPELASATDVPINQANSTDETSMAPVPLESALEVG